MCMHVHTHTHITLHINLVGFLFLQKAETLKFQPNPEVTTTTTTQPNELGEDMLQMALRMASEISEEPVLDLEDSLNPAPIQPSELDKI